MSHARLRNLTIISSAFALSGLVFADATSSESQACLFDVASHMPEEGSKTEIEFIRNCAKQGNPHAQNMLGTLYRTGHGIKKSDRTAVKWYKKAAEQGMPDAQYNLGIMYASGDGVTENEYIAIDWIFRAAQQGHQNAIYTFKIMMSDDLEIGC